MSPKKSTYFFKEEETEKPIPERIHFVHVLPRTLASLILLRLLFYGGTREGRGKVLRPGHLNAFGC